MPKISKDSLLRKLAKKVHDDALPLIDNSKISIFLVGSATTKQQGMRERLRKQLSSPQKYYPRLRIVYPERIFTELLFSGKDYDLLDLENQLANWVHAVVIVPESPGSFAELGAFANHVELNKKLVVIIDKKYNRHRSFIMLGPIRHLKQKTTSQVLFHDYKHDSCEQLSKRVRSAIKAVTGHNTIDRTARNPLIAQEYVLLMLFIFDTLSEDQLTESIQAATGITAPELSAITKSAIALLSESQEIEVRKAEFALTRGGLDHVNDSISSSLDRKSLWSKLDSYRIELLNGTYRN
ncbi:retron St85 family effector protein [bacterium AH-315-J21]|nr:retron St85 family effector protein [bacterium AH-315-J21]